MGEWKDVEQDGIKDHYSLRLTTMEGGGYKLSLYKGDKELDCVVDSDSDWFDAQLLYWKAYYGFTFEG